VDINDHYQISKGNETVEAAAAVEIIENNWEKSEDRAREITRNLMVLGD